SAPASAAVSRAAPSSAPLSAASRTEVGEAAFALTTRDVTLPALAATLDGTGTQRSLAGVALTAGPQAAVVVSATAAPAAAPAGPQRGWALAQVPGLRPPGPREGGGEAALLDEVPQGGWPALPFSPADALLGWDAQAGALPERLSDACFSAAAWLADVGSAA